MLAIRQMTNRERLLAVIRGEEHDRVPFVQYSGIGAANAEIWAEVGRENMGLLQWTAVHAMTRPNCRTVTEEIARNSVRGTRTTISTPAGNLVEERFYEPALGSAHIDKHFVTEPEDYHALIALMRDTIVSADYESIQRVKEALGDDGLPLVNVGRTPYQQLWIQWVCLEDLIYHLADCPELVHDCMDEIGRVLRDIFAVVRDAPVDFVDFGDNITAPPIGIANFQQYCVPCYNELADVLAERNVPVFVHMDGDLMQLSEVIAASKVRGIDSLSPPPDNDTSVGAAARMWPQMRLFVNFPSSVHLRPPEAIYAQAAQILEQAGHTGRLEIQISENPPPGAWRRSYPEIIRAIRDFGKP